MQQINVHEAKTHLSRLLEQVEKGEEIIIARSGRPIARLVPLAPAPSPRPLDTMKGQIWISDDFDAPLPPDLQAAFEGEI